jgi:hypothetical protein
MGWARGASFLALAFVVGCGGTGDDGDGTPPKPRDGGGNTPRDGGTVVSRDGGDDTRDAGSSTPRDGGDPTRDGGGARDGGVNRDGGVGRDGGPRDGGMMPDAGFRDAGPRDGGPQPACPDGTEGCACTFSLTCNDPALTCFAASPPGTPPAQQMHICLRFCSQDTDCTASTVGNTLCRPVRANQQACVSAEVGEGQTADISRLDAPAMTGCQIDLYPLPRFAASGLTALADDQASCGRPCDPNAAMGMPNSCTMTYPYCNPDVIVSVTTPGICTVRRAQSGDVCSRASAVGLCDTAPIGNASPSPVCIGVPYEQLSPGDPSATSDLGTCFIQCALANPNCAFVDDPVVGSAVCRQIRASNTTTGICSNDCTLFPSRCGRPGAFNQGTSCSGDLNFEPAYPISLCRNVQPPTIPEWNWAGQPPVSQRCLVQPGGAVRCEANTRCVSDQPMTGVCIRTCDSSTTAAANMATGCENTPSGNDVCNDNVIGVTGDGLGACVP